MSAGDLLGEVVGALDQAGVPHMLVGSFASTSHGVLAVMADVIDHSYIQRWAKELKVSALLDQAKAG